MKLLVISYRYPPEPGAASARAYSIAEAMKRRGHEVETLRSWSPNIQYQGYLNRFLIYLGFLLSYSWHLISKRPKADVIYYVNPWALSPLSLPAILYAKLTKAKSVLDVHDLITFAFLSSWLADRIVRVEDSLLGIDMAHMVDSQSHGFQNTSERHTMTVMCSGNPNGYDKKTFAEVARRLPEARFKIREFGNGSRADFLSDLAEADIFLCPTKKGYDQMPSKVADYLMLGKPVVYMGEGKMGEILAETKSGFRIARNDVDSARDLIAWLMVDEKLRNEMNHNALRTGETLFSLDAFGERLEKLMA